MYGQKQVSISQFFEKPVNYQELVRGFYGLNYREFVVLSSLNQLDNADTEEIIDHTGEGWPRNKINSALKKLVDLELCQREKVVPVDQKRGFKYSYTSVPADEIRDRILLAFEEFVLVAKQELQDLDFHLKSVDTKAYSVKKLKKEKIRERWFEKDD